MLCSTSNTVVLRVNPHDGQLMAFDLVRNLRLRVSMIVGRTQKHTLDARFFQTLLSRTSDVFISRTALPFP